MNRRATLMLVVITLMGFPALAQPDFAQSDPFLGIWQLNVAKSKYAGPALKSQTMYFWDDEGKIRKNSQVTIREDGIPNAVVIIHTYDDTPHPVPGQRTYDASAYRRIDAHNVSAKYLKAGTVTGTADWIVSQDGNTLTMMVTRVDENGRHSNELRIYEKQQ